MRSPRGSAIAVALVFTLVASIFLTGWVALASNRAMQVSMMEQAAKRRLMVHSSRALAQQTVMDRMFSGYSSLASYTDAKIDPGTAGSALGWGGLNTLSGWSNINYFATPPTAVNFPVTGFSNLVHPYNAMGLRAGASYYRLASTGRNQSQVNQIDNFGGHLFAKGIFPCLGRDLFVVYRKPEQELQEVVLNQNGNFRVIGRLVVRDPASLFNSSTVNRGGLQIVKIQSSSFYVQKCDPLNRVHGSSNNATGTELPPQNYPCVPSTYGPFPRPNGGDPTPEELYRGELNIIENTYVPSGLPASVTRHPNCLWSIQDREAAAATPIPVETISDPVATVPIDTLPQDVPANIGWWIDDQSVRPQPGGATSLGGPRLLPPGWPRGYTDTWRVLYIRAGHASLPNLRIYNVVEQVVFLGQASALEYSDAASRDPRIILILPSPGGDSPRINVQFTGENSRSLILGIKGRRRDPAELYWRGPQIANTPATSVGNAGLDWRLMLINEHRQMILSGRPFLQPESKVILRGGIVTNFSVQRGAEDSTAPTDFRILPDPLCGNTVVADGPVSDYAINTAAGIRLASLLPRDCWLEPYFSLDPPTP
jgi:hypothetical protein